MRVREKNDQIITTHLKRTEELALNPPSFSGKEKAKGSGVGKHNGFSSVTASMTWKKMSMKCLFIKPFRGDKSESAYLSLLCIE